MNYGRDYGNRNFLDRAAHTVRGWLGNRGGHDYDAGYRGGMGRDWDENRGGYREMGDVTGSSRGWHGGMEHGYGATNWTGRNADWNRMQGGGWGRGGGDDYRTGGYQPRHGAWDVDWDDRPMPQGGMGGGMQGRMSGGMMGAGDRYDRGYTQGRASMGRSYDDDMGSRGGSMDRGMMGGGMSRGAQGGMGRGYDRGYRNDYDRGMNAGGMTGRDADVGDVNGGTIGNYGAYGSYGLERFRSGSAGGVPTGQYWTGYGHGSGYNG
jgi:hypothetical protein